MNYVFDDRLPIYLQLINCIKKDIVSGNIKLGDKLPSVREFSSMLRVNPNTVARVYQELEREGITYTQRGMGTFIKEDADMVNKFKKEMAKETIDSFLEDMKKLGFTKEEVLRIIDEGWSK